MEPGALAWLGVGWWSFGTAVHWASAALARTPRQGAAVHHRAADFSIVAPMAGAEEFARYLLVCLTFLAAALVTVEGGQIRMEEFQALIPPRPRWLLQLSIEASGVVVWEPTWKVMPSSAATCRVLTSRRAAAAPWMPNLRSSGIRLFFAGTAMRT